MSKKTTLPNVERLLELRGFEKVNWLGAPAFLNRNRAYVILPDISKMVDKYKPLPIANYVKEELGGIMFVKNRRGRIWAYNLSLYEEAERRLRSAAESPEFTGLYPTLAVSKNGVLFYVWTIYKDGAFGAMFAPIAVDSRYLADTIIGRIENSLSEVRRLFGRASSIQQSSTYQDLLSRLHSLTEDELIDDVVVPLFAKLDFKDVKRVSHHGEGEAGVDIGPFYRINELGILEFSAIQAKAEKIHADTRKLKGNVNEVIRQIDEAFRTPWFHQGTEVRLGTVYVVCSKMITPDAERQLTHAVREGRNVFVVRDNRLVELMRKYHMTLKAE